MKVVNTRLQMRRNTTANWAVEKTFVPLAGEIIVFTDWKKDENGNNIPGMKIGDGNAFLVDLPFFSDDAVINKHINNMEIHVSSEDREKWDKQMSAEVDGENITFNLL